MTTLVIGARGAVGRHVVAGLRAAGKPVRASVRNLAKANLVDGGFGAGVEVVQADLTRPETLPAALDGVRQVFLYAEPSGAADFGKAALVAGVERIVLLSSGSALVPWAASNPILHFVRRGTAADGWYRTDDAERILGRPPVPFATWARDHAADFR